MKKLDFRNPTLGSVFQKFPGFYQEFGFRTPSIEISGSKSPRGLIEGPIGWKHIFKRKNGIGPSGPEEVLAFIRKIVSPQKGVSIPTDMGLDKTPGRFRPLDFHGRGPKAGFQVNAGNK